MTEKATNEEGDEWDEDEDEFEAIILDFKVSRGVKEDGHRKGTKQAVLSELAWLLSLHSQLGACSECGETPHGGVGGLA